MLLRLASSIGIALALAASSAHAANACKSTCRSVRATARTEAATAFKACVEPCRALSGSERRSCKAACRQTRAAARQAATQAFRAGIAICREQGAEANGCTGGGGPGADCTSRPGLPTRLAYTVPAQDDANPATRSDLDNGYSGDSHNFPVVQGSTLNFCLDGCDTTTNPVCQASGPTGTGTENGPTFGAPLPLLANGVPVCVVNRYQDAQITGSYNLQTGEMSAQVNLLSDVYVLTDATLKNVCPRCSGDGTIGSTGACVGGRNDGQTCVVGGVTNVVGSSPSAYQLSGDCLPSQGSFGATLVIQLPLTSGTSTKTGSKPCPGQTIEDSCGTGSCTVDCSATPATKGGLNQLCCSNDPNRPCFPTATDSSGTIERTGTVAVTAPTWPDPTYPKTASGARLAATFCEAKTGSAQVDILTGLPGPGAILLPGNVSVSLGE